MFGSAIAFAFITSEGVSSVSMAWYFGCSGAWTLSWASYAVLQTNYNFQGLVVLTVVLAVVLGLLVWRHIEFYFAKFPEACFPIGAAACMVFIERCIPAHWDILVAAAILRRRGYNV